MSDTSNEQLIAHLQYNATHYNDGTQYAAAQRIAELEARLKRQVGQTDVYKERERLCVEYIAELEAERDQLRAALLSAPPIDDDDWNVDRGDYSRWYRAKVEPLKDGRG